MPSCLMGRLFMRVNTEGILTEILQILGHYRIQEGALLT